MAKGIQQTSVTLQVKDIKDLPKVVDQIHTLAKRLSAGSGVTVTVITPQEADTSADEKSLL